MDDALSPSTTIQPHTYPYNKKRLYGAPPKHLLHPTTADLALLCALAPKALALHYVPVTDRAGLVLPSLGGGTGGGALFVSGLV